MGGMPLRSCLRGPGWGFGSSLVGGLGEGEKKENMVVAMMLVVLGVYTRRGGAQRRSRSWRDGWMAIEVIYSGITGPAAGHWGINTVTSCTLAEVPGPLAVAM